MADQEISFVLKAVNQASAELSKVAKDLGSLGAVAKSTNADAAGLGSAWKAGGAAAREGAGLAATGFRELDTAAKNAVQGGVRELTGDIPIVGASLSKLAGTLTGFPLLLGGIAAAGVGLLTFLNNMDAQATQSQRSIEKLGRTIEGDFRKSILETNALAARASQDMVAQIAADYALMVESAKRAREDRKTVNEQMLEDNISFWKILTGQATRAVNDYRREKQRLTQQEQDDDKAANDKRLAAEIDFARVRLEQTKSLYSGMREAVAAATTASLESEGKITESLEAQRQKRHADITREYNDRIDAIKKMRYSAEEEERQITAAQAEESSKRVKLEIETQEQRRAAIESATTSALSIFEKLGKEFETSSKKLSLASYLQGAQRDIDALKKLQDAIGSGDSNLAKAGITADKVAQAIAKLGSNMADATARGVVPLATAATTATAALETVAPAAEKAAEGAARLFNTGAAATPLLETLDALIAKANQVTAAMAAAGRGGIAPVGFPGATGGLGPTGLAAGGTTGGGGGAALPGAWGMGGASDAYLNATIFRHLSDIANQPKGSGLSPSFGPSAYSLEGFTHPAGPVNMPSSSFGNRPATTTVSDTLNGGRPISITFQSGAIQQSGTVIQGDRDWATLTNQMAQDISAKLRR